MIDVTVLAYSPTWEITEEPFRRCFAKFWAGGQEPRIFQGGGAWSDMALGFCNACAGLGIKQTVLLLDDYLLSDHVNAELIQRCWNLLAAETSFGFVRLNPCPGPTMPVQGLDWLGEFDHTQPYLTSLQPSIWRIECLRSLLEHGESAWDFEIYGTARAAMSAWRFLGTHATLVPNQNMLRMGVVVPAVQEWLNQLG
jgi:hypothetical protein